MTRYYVLTHHGNRWGPYRRYERAERSAERSGAHVVTYERGVPRVVTEQERQHMTRKRWLLRQIWQKP